MSLEEIQGKILGLLYEKWFENHITGEWSEELASKVHADPNKLDQALGLLESNYLIERDGCMYRITISGIEAFENSLLPSEISKKEAERKLILETLKELYETNTGAQLEYEELSAKVTISDFFYLSSTVEILERKGLVFLERSAGQHFSIRLTPGGFRAFQDQTIDMSMTMASTYRILFRLENHLREFIETKLREKYGSDWWEKGVGQGNRDKADEFRKEEMSVGWSVATTSSQMEYLQFKHLGGIVVKNWKVVFEPIFHDLTRIQHRLDELEIIRNAIAHTRTLSQEGLLRLEMYNQDILKMTA